MKEERIAIAGNGELAMRCVLSVQKFFEGIDIISDDEAVLQQKRAKDRVIDTFLESDAHTILLAGWLGVIPEHVLREKEFLNFHGSILPKYRGLHSIFWAIMNGEEELGYTIHKVERGIDAGDILYQYKFGHQGECIDQIMSLFYADIEKSLGKVVCDYLEGKIILQGQDEGLASWVPKRNLEDCLIDFRMSNTLLKRFFLALTPPYPRPRIQYKDKVYEILDFEILDRDYYCDLGRVVNIDDVGAWIKVQDGLLIVKRVREVESVIELEANLIFARGARLGIGRRN